MNTNYNILQQINKANNVYVVPYNYFNTLAQQIMLKINAKQNTFQVPKNYFNNVSFSIIEKIKLQQQNDVYAELQIVAPTLNSISKANIYTTPTHYFEQLNYAKSSSKIVNFSITKWHRYVAAAVVIFIVGFGYIINKNKPDTAIIAMHQTAVNTNVIAAISNLNDTDLNKTIDTDKLVFKTNEASQPNVPFLGLLQDEVEYISDAEMDLYFANNNAANEEIENINS